MDFFGNLLSAGANLLGGIMGRQSSRDIAAQNIAEQEKFAQSGLQWKAADATAAQASTGINRLALLGAPTASFSNIVGDNSLGAGVAAAGQDVGRAANALTTSETKQSQLENRLLELKIQGAQQDIVAQQLANSKNARDLASPGTAAKLVNIPLPVAAPHSRDTLPLTRTYRTKFGERVEMPTAEASQSLQNFASAPLVPVVGGDLARHMLPNWGDAASRSGFVQGLEQARGDVIRHLSKYGYDFP